MRVDCQHNIFYISCIIVTAGQCATLFGSFFFFCLFCFLWLISFIFGCSLLVFFLFVFLSVFYGYFVLFLVSSSFSRMMLFLHKIFLNCTMFSFTILICIFCITFCLILISLIDHCCILYNFSLWRFETVRDCYVFKWIFFAFGFLFFIYCFGNNNYVTSIFPK